MSERHRGPPRALPPRKKEGRVTALLWDAGGNGGDPPLQDGSRRPPHSELPVDEGRTGRDRRAARGLTADRGVAWRTSPSTAASARSAGEKASSRARAAGGGRAPVRPSP